MQIVIEIPEDDYRKAQDGRASVSMMQKAIKNGTPLPKGHRKLIILSEDAVKREQISFSFSSQNWISEVGLSNAIVAIIEADKESEDGE